MTAKNEEPKRTGTDDLLPTRQSLIGRLKDWEDSASWQAFFDSYARLIYKVALKAGLTETEADEVVQETVVSVAKAMKGFHYDTARGSFKGWLLQLTGWRITNQLHKRRSAGHSDQGHEQPQTRLEDWASPCETRVPAELERLWDAEWEENLLETALKRVRSRVNPKHFQIFDLCVRKQMSVKEVRQFLGVTAMEIYLSRHRIMRLVQQEIARLREQLF